MVPVDELLHGLRELCDETGTLLVFDEVTRYINGAARSDKERAKRFFMHHLERGNLILVPDLRHAAISNAHTIEDIEFFLEFIEEFVESAKSCR